MSNKPLRETTGVFNTDSFQIRGVQEPLWRYSQIFMSGQDILTINLPDIITDQQRYHMQVVSTVASKIQIKLGEILIFESDIEADVPIKLNKLLLYPSQLLQIYIDSLEQGELELVLDRSEDTGRIIRKNQRSIQASSSEDWLFDPTLQNGLTHLKPHEGELVIHDDFKITSVLVNGVDRSDFQSGVLILETEDPTVLNEFCQRYNAEIISQRDHRYLMKLDLAYSPINRLPELISLYNQAIEVNIEQASFASLEGMKTFAILLDAITHNVNWYPFSAELNSILEPHQAQNPLQDWDYNRAQVGFSWWLIDSKIQQLNGEKAWDYSLGTGVKTAVFDRGFAQSHPEINRRWLVGNKDGTEYHNNDGNLWKSNEGHTPDHGHKSVMTLAAEKDNKIKTAGSAPNAKVAPYFTWDAWAMENAVYKAASAGVKVVNISIAEEDFTWVTYSALAIPGFGSLIFDQLWHITRQWFNAGNSTCYTSWGYLCRICR